MLLSKILWMLIQMQVLLAENRTTVNVTSPVHDSNVTWPLGNVNAEINLSHERIAEIEHLINNTKSAIATTLCQGAEYIVSIRWGRRTTLGTFHICGGVPISTYFVISAATCFIRSSRKFLAPKNILVAISCRNRFEKNALTENFKVRDIFFQKEYFRRPEDDLAVLVLKEPLPEFSPMIKMPALATTLPPNGTKCFAMGWGRTSLVGPVTADLTVDNYTIIHSEACGALYPYIVNDNLICAYGSANKTRTLCGEDSGGPLICNGTLYGIISGFNDCSEDRLSFFTPLASHYRWIVMNNYNDNAKLVLTGMVLFAVLSVLVLVNKHRAC